MLRRLPSYLKTYRKRTGLSQAEVAFLLGCKSGAKISRYERGTRVPPLRTGLAYEAVLGAPVRELFAGVFEEAEVTARERAKTLLQSVRSANPRRRHERKIGRLEVLAGRRTRV